MTDKRCENGHFIDASWDLCPYCPPQRRTAGPVPPLATVPRREEPKLIVPRPNARGEADPESKALPDGRTAASRKVDPADSPRYVVGWLVGMNGSVVGESYPLRMGRNILGRDRKSDVVVPDEQASAHHADLVYRPEENRFLLMDHNSTNGTYVNDLEIEPRRNLNDRDVIRIGTQRFMFVALCGNEFSWTTDANDRDMTR